MLDEPFAGIDPVTVQNIQLIIKELADRGIAILITDHAAREILQITDRTYVVSEGRILVDGTAEQIIQHDQVRTKYLGDIDFKKKIRIDVDGSESASSSGGPVEKGSSGDEISFKSNSNVRGGRRSSAMEADVAFVSEPESPKLKQTDLD